MMDDDFKNMQNCFCCERYFQYGPHVYAGKWVKRYKILVCDICYKMSWDGWAPAYQDKIVAHLEAENIAVPKRNNKGWLPRD